jgi:hypothetical protein
MINSETLHLVVPKLQKIGNCTGPRSCLSSSFVDGQAVAKARCVSDCRSC